MVLQFIIGGVVIKGMEVVGVEAAERADSLKLAGLVVVKEGMGIEEA